MLNRGWKQSHGKIRNAQNKIRKSGRNHKTKDEMKSAFTDEKELKRKKRRLTIDWFFRPEGD
jgi:hypothetical protein